MSSHFTPNVEDNTFPWIEIKLTLFISDSPDGTLRKDEAEEGLELAACNWLADD